MTAALDLQPEGSHALALAVEELHDLLDRVLAMPLEDVESALVITEWERASRRVDAVRLRLIQAAEKNEIAAEKGMSSTGAWVARETTDDSATAVRAAKLADALTRPASGGGPAQRTATALALESGALSMEHASIIIWALAQLPDHVSGHERRTIERHLIAQAEQLSPSRLRRAARRALAAVEPDESIVDDHENSLVAAQERRALAKSRLTLHDNGDGTTNGYFTVPTVAAAVLRRILDTMTSPRRGRIGASATQAGDQSVDRDWAHERGLSFIDLLERLPSDHLHGKVAASVVVTIAEDSLRGRLKAARIDAGDLVSTDEARRLACQSRILPAVLDGNSQPLDLGRAKRLFTESQRVAGAVIHTECCADGCEVGYAWCHLHHADPWEHGGRTDLDVMTPLCGFHHRRIHDPSYLHERLPDGSIRFNRRT